MNKSTLATLIAATLLAAPAMAQTQGEVMGKEGKATVVNTTTLGKSIKGFRGPTPLKIYVENSKIVKIVPLKNMETPRYFQKAEQLLKKYEGVSVKKASKMKVDGVTGATFSSKALKENVKVGAKYYLKHK